MTSPVPVRRVRPASRSSTVCDIFASHAEDYWAAGKLELRYTYLLHGVSLALEKAIVPGYVTKSGESGDLVPYDDAEEIARARRPRRGASLRPYRASRGE